MSLACPDSTTLVDSELNQLYGDGIGLSLLPASQVPASDRESTGRLTSKAVDAIVVNLTNTGIVPNVKQNSQETLQSKQADFLKNVKSEYCFYYSRYKYALIKLLEAIQQGYSTSTPDKKQIADKYLASTQALNQKLNDLVQITNAITAYMLSVATSMNAEIQQVNQTLQAQKDKLAHQYQVISSGEATKKLSKDMVRYTQEKARYTDNLLTLYSAINIVTFGLLIYVYKSAAD